MKIFIIGLPQSGKTSIAKFLAKEKEFCYIDVSYWSKLTFPDHYSLDNIPEEKLEDYYQYFTKQLKEDKNFYYDNIKKVIKIHNKSESCKNFVVEGILDPSDFIRLFNYNEDVVVFLNRLDNDVRHSEQSNISFSIIKDYCLWLASMNLLEKSKWIEYNFKMPQIDDKSVKSIGVHNNIFIIKCFNTVFEHIKVILNA